MNEKYMFTTIFRSVYIKKNIERKNNNFIKIKNKDVLEEILYNYVIKSIGYCSDYSKYYDEIGLLFENIITNIPYVYSFENLVDEINKYVEKYIKKLNEKKYTSLFIQAMTQQYSSDHIKAVVINNKNTYVIGKKSRLEEEEMPKIVIRDIDELENILEKLVATYNMSSHVYGNLLRTDEDDDIVLFFSWIIKNATTEDLSDIGKYLNKYISYVQDDTFEDFKYPNYLGNFFNDELWAKISSSDVAYETPYYFVFMLRNNHLILPYVRYGIDNGKEKTANILAIQTPNAYNPKNDELNKYIKENLPKSKNFRNYNPSHLISFTLFIGILLSKGIKQITIADYLPFRYQRFILENRKSVDELEDHQKRLTNKEIFTYMRLMEFTDGLEIINYPENNTPFILKIKDDIHFENEFLENLLNLGKSFKDKEEKKL